MQSLSGDENTNQNRSAPGDVARTWRVIIDLSAPRAKADQLFTRVRDRWKSDRAVVGIDLLAME